MQSTASGFAPKCQICAPPLWGDGSVTQLQPAPPCTTAATRDLNAHLKVLRWRKTQHKQKHQPRCATVINLQVFKSINVENKLRLMKVIVTFQQMKRELLGFWQVRLAKSQDLSVLQHLPAMENHGHDTQHHGQLLERAHTGSWQRTGTWAFTASCWEAYSGFSAWEAPPEEDTTRKYFVFFQAKAANSWELTVPDRGTVSS